MEVEWFCQIMGSEVGPLTQVQLIDMVRNQQVTPEDLVKRNNSSWVAAFEVKGLFAAATAAKSSSAKTPAAEKKSVRQASVSANDVQPQSQSRRDPKASLHRGKLATERPKPGTERSHAGGSSVADWYCIASGEKQGPLGFEELQTLAQEGQLRQTDRVWRSSSPKFRKASEIEGLT